MDLLLAEMRDWAWFADAGLVDPTTKTLQPLSFPKTQRLLVQGKALVAVLHHTWGGKYWKTEVFIIEPKSIPGKKSGVESVTLQMFSDALHKIIPEGEAGLTDIIFAGEDQHTVVCFLAFDY